MRLLSGNSKKWSKVGVQVFALAFAFIVSGCKGIPEQVNGRYYGEVVTHAGRAQVMSDIPTFDSHLTSKTLDFQVIPISSNIKPTAIHLKLTSKSGELTVAGMADSVKLKQDGMGCAIARDSRQNLHICMTPGRIEIGSGDSYLLTLERFDQISTFSQSEGRSYSLDELVGRARYFNYSVEAEAERVFQAKKEIGVSVGNLLPHMRVASLVGLSTGTSWSIFDAVGSLVPFLFPSNWYRLKGDQDLYAAERASMAALRGNEINVVEGLYYAVLRDQAVLGLLDQQLEQTRRIQKVIEAREEAGREVPGTGAYFGTKIAELELDRGGLADHVQTSLSILAHAVGLPPIGSITDLIRVPLPDPALLKPIHAQDYVNTALDRSFELRTVDSLIQAAKHSRKELIWSWLSPESGQDVGFAVAPTISISKSKIRSLEVKRDEVHSQIELQSQLLEYEYNRAIESYTVTRAARLDVEQYLKRMVIMYMDQGGDSSGFASEYISAHQRLQQFLGDEYTMMTEILMVRAKYNRLLGEGYYKDLMDPKPAEVSGQAGSTKPL